MTTMRILIVDDDPLACEMAAAIVESVGHEVLSAEHGVAAMQVLASEADIALVISDMHMPLINGIELFREIRSQGLMLPFILLTGSDPDTLLQQEPGLAACIVKDYSLEETLPMTIATVMTQHARL